MGKYRSIVLAKLPSPPTLPMLREMLIKAQELPGSIVQIPFGDDGSQAYSLSACITQKNESCVCSWALFKGDCVDSAAVEWTYAGEDTQQVINYLTTRFPGWSQQSRLHTPEIQTFKKQSHNAIAARPSQRSILEGDLANMPITNLLQSVAMNKMTGRLEIQNGSDEATVWFDQGVLADCEIPGAAGDDALIELVCWEQGEFYFFPELKIEKHSVEKRMEILIMEGAIFHDQYSALLKLNFSFGSIVYRKSVALSENEFDETTRRGIPVDIGLQKQVYCALTEKKPVSELMQSLKISKIQLVPIIFNLIILDVLAIDHETLASNLPPQTEHALDFDETARTPNVESAGGDTDWHKVKPKAKAEILPTPTDGERQTMDFVQEIKVLNSLSRASQPAGKERVKVKKRRPAAITNNFLQPVLVLLAIVLTCLYLQSFQSHNSTNKRPSRPPAPVSAKGQHAVKRSVF